MKSRSLSLRRTLLLGILLPVFGFVLINTVVLYRQALAAADTAYDRTLLATAKSLGEQIYGARLTAETGATSVWWGRQYDPVAVAFQASGAPVSSLLEDFRAALRADVTRMEEEWLELEMLREELEG